MSEVLDVTGDDRDGAVEAAAAALRGGGVVVLPTDTVYGIAADAFATAGTARIFALKQRDRSLPLPVLVRGPKQLAGLVTMVPAAAERLMAAYWPGPLTIVVASDPNLAWDLGAAQGTVAVRMPFDETTLDVIRAVGPLAVSSANLSGRAAATDIDAARDQFGDDVDVYLDAGPRTRMRPSTIVDLTRREVAVLREGDLDTEQVLAVARGEIDVVAAHHPMDGFGAGPAVDGGGAPAAARDGGSRHEPDGGGSEAGEARRRPDSGAGASEGSASSGEWGGGDSGPTGSGSPPPAGGDEP